MPSKTVSGQKTGSNNILPLDSLKHAGLGINARQFERFARRHNAIPLNLAEFFYAARYYPIVFVKSSVAPIQSCAISGLQQGENLFIDHSGQWLPHHYQPAYIRRYPFYNTTAGTDNDKTLILVDETGLEASADPYFDSAGQATAKWQQCESFLRDYIAAERLTADFAARLDELGLLEAFDAQINPQQRDSQRITGMHRVNEDRLNKLPADVIQDMMQQGELSRIYAHLISLENFARLLDLSAAREQPKTITNN